MFYYLGSVSSLIPVSYYKYYTIPSSLVTAGYTSVLPIANSLLSLTK